MKKHALALKYRGRMDRLAPAIAIAEMSRVAKKKLPSVIRRLFEMATDRDPRVALKAVAELREWMGVSAFIAAGLKRMSEAPPDEEDDEEDDRDERDRRVAKRYRDVEPAASASPT